MQKALQLTNDLRQLHSWINQQIQTIPAPKRKLVTTHDAHNIMDVLMELRSQVL